MKEQCATRRVELFRREKVDGKFVNVSDGFGNFAFYGIDFEEFEEGPGYFTVAIVKMDDGTVRSVPVTMIRFILGES